MTASTVTHGNWAEENQEDFEAASREEIGHHKNLQETFTLTLGRKQLLEKPEHTNFQKSPDDPTSEKDQGHCERHIDIRVGTAEPGLVDCETVRGLVSPSDRAYSRNKPHPVRRENESEDGCKKPERPPG